MATPNIFLIPVFHKALGRITAAIIGGNTRSGLAETMGKADRRYIGGTAPIVTIQSYALQPVGIVSAAAGVMPQAGSTDLVVSLSDQPVTRSATTIVKPPIIRTR